MLGDIVVQDATAQDRRTERGARIRDSYVDDRGDVIGMDRFGAPGPVVMREYGFSVDNVCKRALGTFVVGHALAWELVTTFLAARFSGAERHLRRLSKVEKREHKETRS